MQPWVGYDGSKYLVTHIYKETGWLYLNDTFLFITASGSTASHQGSWSSTVES